MLLITLGDWAIRLASLTALIFAVHYALTAPFYRSQEGWLMLTIFTFFGVVVGH